MSMYMSLKGVESLCDLLVCSIMYMYVCVSVCAQFYMCLCGLLVCSNVNMYVCVSVCAQFICV